MYHSATDQAAEAPVWGEEKSPFAARVGVKVPIAVKMSPLAPKWGKRGPPMSLVGESPPPKEEKDQ